MNYIRYKMHFNYNVLFIFQMLSTIIEAKYSFTSHAEEHACWLTKLTQITPYRVVSDNEFGWKDAEACCHMKGYILHTIERSDESSVFPLRDVFLQKAVENEDQVDEFLVWIGAHRHKHAHYQWKYGTNLKYLNKQLSRDVYRWAKDVGTPDPKTSPACVSLRISRNSKTLEFTPEECSLRLRFICQKVEQRGGSPLRGYDVMKVGSVEFYNIPGFDSLKFASITARWSVANAICQANNWNLIDHVHDRYGESLIAEIAKNRSLYLFDKKVENHGFHTSGNDFCHPHSWAWGCGEYSLNIPFQNKKSNADKLYNHVERCLQFLVENSTNETAQLVAAHVNCNQIGYVICDSNPQCNPDKQYSCLHQEPHFINVERGIEDEHHRCKNNLTFTAITIPEYGSTFYISHKQFTWKGAKSCCAMQNDKWVLATPRWPEQLSVLTTHIFKNISKICSSGIKCDGFWTETTTLGGHLESPLRFSDGEALPRSMMLTWGRTDLFSYPSCGRINLIDFNGLEAKYVHANCLEKNFLVCEEVQEYVEVKLDFIKSESDEEVNSDEKEKVEGRNEVLFKESHKKSKSKTGIKFDRKRFDNFFEELIPKEKEFRFWDRNRDTCTNMETLKHYEETCPESSSTLSFDGKKPSKSSLAKNDELELIVSNQNTIFLQLLLNTSFSLPGTGSSEDIDSFPYAFQLLNIATTLYSQMCPLVPARFTERAVELFRKYYVTYLYPKPRSEIMQKEDFKWTMNILRKCLDLAKPTKLMNDLCGEFVVAKNCNCSDFICTDARYESNLYKSDILMDVVWKVFESAYSICFPAFTQNIRLHHKFAMTMTDLWEHKELRIRWSHQIEDKRFWIRLLGPTFEKHLINMERCNAANIEASYYKLRLSPKSLPISSRLVQS